MVKEADSAAHELELSDITGPEQPFAQDFGSLWNAKKLDILNLPDGQLLSTYETTIRKLRGARAAYDQEMEKARRVQVSILCFYNGKGAKLIMLVSGREQEANIRLRAIHTRVSGSLAYGRLTCGLYHICEILKERSILMLYLTALECY